MLNKIDKAYKTAFAYQVLYDSRMYNYLKTESETIHSIFHNQTNQTKPKTIK